MKAFLFAPSNRLVGKLDVSSVDDVAKAVEAFAQGNVDIPNFSYVECGKRVWTITTVSPFQIVEGKVQMDPVVTPKAEPYGVSDFVDSASSVAVLVIWGIALLALIFTILGWLKTGQWVPFETAWVFKEFPKVKEWVAAPSDWAGLAKIAWIVSLFPWMLLIAVGCSIVRVWDEGRESVVGFVVLICFFIAASL